MTNDVWTVSAKTKKQVARKFTATEKEKRKKTAEYFKKEKAGRKLREEYELELQKIKDTDYENWKKKKGY